jgi:hypothetical protein
LPPVLASAHAVLRRWRDFLAAPNDAPTQHFNTLSDLDGVEEMDAAPAAGTQRDDDGDVIMQSPAEDDQGASPDDDVNDNDDDDVPRPPGDAGAARPASGNLTPLTSFFTSAVLIWASCAPTDAADAFTALLGGRTVPAVAPARAAPRNPNHALGGRRPGPAQARSDDDDPDFAAGGDSDPEQLRPQHELTRCLVRRQRDALHAELARGGLTGRLVAAQLHSQSGPGALSWVDAAQGLVTMHTLPAITFLLITLMVEPWRVGGATCPFCNLGADKAAGPTCVHILGCSRQHDRGCMATHTQVKRGLQALLARHHAPWFVNENPACFTVPDRKADTSLAQGSLALASKEAWRSKGHILDSSVRSPTVMKVLAPRRGSAVRKGLAAAVGEDEKVKHHSGTFDESRWVFHPIVQESFGRFGASARAFIKQLACHSAACGGGGAAVVRRRRGIAMRRIVCTMSSTLVRELAERVLAFVTSAVKKGRPIRPVSRLLAFGSGLPEDMLA